MAATDCESRCFVGGLAWATTDKELADAFSSYGDVVDSKIITDRDTGRSRGFGFVTFSNAGEMKDAIEAMNGQDLGGRNITVNEAQSRGNGGGGGGYRRDRGGYGGRSGYERRDGGYSGGGGGGGYGRRDGGYGGGQDWGYGGSDRGYSRSGGDRGYSRSGGPSEGSWPDLSVSNLDEKKPRVFS